MQTIKYLSPNTDTSSWQQLAQQRNAAIQPYQTFPFQLVSSIEAIRHSFRYDNFTFKFISQHACIPCQTTCHLLKQKKPLRISSKMPTFSLHFHQQNCNRVFQLTSSQKFIPSVPCSHTALALFGLLHDEAVLWLHGGPYTLIPALPLACIFSDSGIWEWIDAKCVSYEASPCIYHASITSLSFWNKHTEVG